MTDGFEASIACLETKADTCFIKNKSKPVQDSTVCGGTFSICNLQTQQLKLPETAFKSDADFTQWTLTMTQTGEKHLV